MSRSTGQRPNCCWRNKDVNDTYGKGMVRGLQPVGGTNIFDFWQSGLYGELPDCSVN